jgi:hypothetical protein
MEELAEIPTPATVDYYRLFETMDKRLRERVVTTDAYFDWHLRRARLNLAREQWQRLRVFREGLEFRRQRDTELTAKEARPNVPRRVSSNIKEKKEMVKEVTQARKRSTEPNVAATGSSLSPPTPDVKIYPGTWERKTMMGGR